jgi:hypothetical protein
VKINEGANPTGGCCQSYRQAVDGGILGRVAWCYASVGLAAGIWCRAPLRRLRSPLKDPVAVAVCAEASCIQGRAWLAVFAPEAVGSLRIDKACSVLLSDRREVIDEITIRVVKRDEVKIVVVEEGGYVCVAGFVAVDKLVGEVFNHYQVLEE